MFVVEKYKGRWAVLDTVSRVWYFIGFGKRFCDMKARELNRELNRELKGE